MKKRTNQHDTSREQRKNGVLFLFIDTLAKGFKFQSAFIVFMHFTSVSAVLIKLFNLRVFFLFICNL